MDLEALQALIIAGPDNGTQVQRKDFRQMMETAEHRGCAVLVSTNYQCLDPYSDAQRVVYLGFTGHIWTGAMRSEPFTLTNKDNLLTVLEAAYQHSQEHCDHDYGRELGQDECRQRGVGHYGNCWHVYECPKCQEPKCCVSKPGKFTSTPGLSPARR